MWFNLQLQHSPATIEFLSSFVNSLLVYWVLIFTIYNFNIVKPKHSFNKFTSELKSIVKLDWERRLSNTCKWSINSNNYSGPTNVPIPLWPTKLQQTKPKQESIRTDTKTVTEQQKCWLTETDANAEGWAVIAQPQIMLMLSFNEWISSVFVPGLLPPYVEHTLCFHKF